VSRSAQKGVEPLGDALPALDQEALLALHFKQLAARGYALGLEGADARLPDEGREVQPRRLVSDFRKTSPTTFSLLQLGHGT
jgi:hypothetical protein